MDPQRDFYDRVHTREKALYDKEQQKKWDQRGKKFWSTFLFTEDGKPKSSLLIYTFSLSFVLVFLFLAAFGLLIDPLNALCSAMPAFAVNLITCLACTVIVMIPTCIFHHFVKDKRLAFGGFLWLDIYAVAILITELIMMWGDTEAIGMFLAFFFWFFALPVIIGSGITFFLFKRDYKPAPTPEPEWKKYVTRR